MPHVPRSHAGEGAASFDGAALCPQVWCYAKGATVVAEGAGDRYTASPRTIASAAGRWPAFPSRNAAIFSATSRRCSCPGRM